MASNGVYIGQRRSYAGGLCTIRYQGPLPSLKGEWLGVEWDDPTRAASFVRPSRKPDPERTLLEAVKFKYAPTTVPNANNNVADETIEISGKVVEEVGFERIQKQLSVLTDLKIVLIDELVVSGVARRGASRDEIRQAQFELAQTCPNIVELDIGWNVIETWQDVADICQPLKKLKISKASGLRLRNFKAKVSEGEENPFQNVEELHLNECLLTPEQTAQILSPGGTCGFSSLKTLTLSSNELHFFGNVGKKEELRCASVTTLVLENNKFTDLSSLPILVSLFPNTTSLSLQGNLVSEIGLDGLRYADPPRFDKLETLNFAGNRIGSYAFIDSLPGLFPNLTSLRISRNPLYAWTQGDGGQGDEVKRQVASAAADSTSYYLTLARIPGLKSLNYTSITSRDREEGEIYYLSVAEREIKTFLLETAVAGTTEDTNIEQRAAQARRSHPLYASLCAQYEREDIIARFLDESAKQAQQDQNETKKKTTTTKTSELDGYAPGTLGSRLVDAYFYMPSSSSTASATSEKASQSEQHRKFQRFLPPTVSVYRLKSLIAKLFNLPPLQFRLVYESHEYDPVEPISRTTRRDGKSGQNDWDAWGDWEVDDIEHDDHDHDQDHGHEDEDLDADVDGMVGHGHEALQKEEGSEPMYITRDGQRFKKRETEILDGMRGWGDFLDLTTSDGSRRREVRVRVEPYTNR
ncbi:hypothetical protein LTR47_003174 [Exophiala xenobiotica]|nr:hypothetical protein LTR72_006238 [Exophiala xenobiotica]KAK5235701.1 hypothetical protein LTR47_003174 [Exophiala xenobiotica]KAK5250510.1 hypothetical protein LTS06_004764 [Exophiala xenobiotica]KAK5262213.1 hypothetical protein LTR40_000780 [Exophiala xenobiotica]KAK5295017.1 hypothetical protein LTR14_004187 [Exophiala xenobiotica]